jgi:putative membrane protein
MVFLSIPTYFYLIKKTSSIKAIKTILILSLFSMIIETIGVVTGIPYGFFSYTQSLGAKIGVVPWTVSFGWVPLVIASWTLTDRFLKNQTSILKKAIVGSVIITIFDLVLDPGAVALNFWVWSPQGVYYNVPISNFLGWIFSGFIGMIIILKIMKNEKPDNNLLLTAFFGNIFWTFIAIMGGMTIPMVLGIALTIFLSKIIFLK